MSRGPIALAAVPGCGFLAEPVLEAWLAGTLEADRRAAFESHRDACRACTLLAADLDAWSEIAARGPLASEREEFERRAAAAREALALELRRPAPRRSQPSRGWLAFGAVLAAAALLAVMIWPFVASEPGAIALPGGGSVTLEPPEFSPPPEVRDRQRAIELWTEAERAWKARDWVRAGAALEQIVEQDPESHDARLYLGLAHLSRGRYDDALETLEEARVIAEREGLGGALADYSLGLAALGEGDVALARQALGRAVEAGGAWGERAAALLAELD
jgi:tetratricopeptide (TPR) repeat protein